MAAAIAAAEQARRLDPRIRTSGANTLFMLGEYERVLDFQPETVPYLPSLALLMLDRIDEAKVMLARPSTWQVAGRLGTFLKALLAFVAGDEDQTLHHFRQMSDIPDPEGRYYAARGIAYLGKADEVLPLLAGVVEQGFFCVTAFNRDPWLDSLRGSPDFTAIVRHAESRHRQAVISFLNAEGDRVLGCGASRLIQSSFETGGSHRGPEPVQSQPANRVRAGRQQR